MADPRIYGKGPKFPLVGNFHTSKDKQLVRESLFQLLATNKRERLFHVGFGSDILSRLFENFNTVEEFGPIDIATVIKKYEPRVDLIDVLIDKDEGQGLIRIYIIYRLIQQNVVDNMVIIVNENGAILE